MKRFHVHVGARDLQQSIRFYSALFAAAPVYGEDRVSRGVEEKKAFCSPVTV